MLKVKLKRAGVLLVALAALIVGGYFGDMKVECRAQMGRPGELSTELCKFYAIKKHQTLGVVYTCLGRNFEAFRSYSKWVWYDGDNAMAKHGRQYNYLMMLKRGSVLSDLEFYRSKLLDSSRCGEPAQMNKDPYWSMLAESYLPETKDLQAYIDLKETRAVAYVQRGMLYYRDSKLGYAEGDLSNAIYRDPQSSLAYLYRARTRTLLNNLAGAAEDYKKAVELEPQSKVTITEHAVISSLVETWAPVNEALDKAIQLYPSDGVLYLARALFRMDQQDFAAAEADLEQSEKLCNNWTINLAKGLKEELQGNSEQAWEEYRKLEEEFKRSRYFFGGGNPFLLRILCERMNEKRQLKHKLIIDKPYDPEQLLQEVIDQRFQGNREGITKISWASLPNDIYGRTFVQSQYIEISDKLNSSQVPRECVKMLIYHECLHAKGYSDHNQAFYEQESKYPDYEKLNTFLNYDLAFNFKE